MTVVWWPNLLQKFLTGSSCAAEVPMKSTRTSNLNIHIIESMACCCRGIRHQLEASSVAFLPTAGIKTRCVIVMSA